MRPLPSLTILTGAAIVVGLLSSAALCPGGQRGGGRGMGLQGSFGTAAPAVAYAAPVYGGYGYGGYGGYGNYGFSNYGYSQSLPVAAPYLPDRWWTGSYSSSDPRGVGYNPDAGYAWDTVTTLLLETFPVKARVTLDGIFVGTADLLGPFQLPIGHHVLRVDAAGYEPSETVLQVAKPVVQQLMVRLNEVKHIAKAAPRK